MGKKSKRSRGSGGGGGKVKDSFSSQQRAAPALRKEPVEEEETVDNLRFEDPFEDVYEEEDDEDEDNMDETEEDAKIPSQKTNQQEKEIIQSWNPLTSDTSTLPPNTSLVIDESAYKMHHSLTTEWPSLSFDILPDELGMNRKKFPHSLIMAVGTQADRSDRNRVTVMKMSDLGPCGGYKSEKQIEDEMLGEEYNPDDDDDDDSNASEEEEEDLDLDPILEHYSLQHKGGVNRLRIMPQHNNIVSTWSDAGTVNLYNIEGILGAFERSSGGGSMNAKSLQSKKDKEPFFVYSGHNTEGWAMDWSKVTTGNLATGDCDGSIHIWSLSSSGTWNNSSFTVTPTYNTPTTNADIPPSIEDIQWSPTESTVFATGECGGYVRIYDTRCSGKPMLSTHVTDGSVDVNVISWNGLVSNLLASGADDGTFSVWDLRNFQSSSQAPLARFTAHKKPITSLEWHPTDESMIAVSDEDGTYVYDLSIEEDEDEKQEGDNALPPQLLFVHCGSVSTKEVHWHPQIVSCLVTTSLSGFSAFIPSNL